MFIYFDKSKKIYTMIYSCYSNKTSESLNSTICSSYGYSGNTSLYSSIMPTGKNLPPMKFLPWKCFMQGFGAESEIFIAGWKPK